MKRTALDPLYHQRVDFCDDRESCIKAINRRWKMAGHDPVAKDYLNDCNGITQEIDEAIVLGVFDGKPSTLAHECVHAAVKTLRLRGVPITAQNDEALAYLVGWFVSAWHRSMS